jgi:hypothetical protein
MIATSIAQTPPLSNGSASLPPEPRTFVFESKEISSRVLIPAWKNWAIGGIHMRNFWIEVSGAEITPLDRRDGSL